MRGSDGVQRHIMCGIVDEECHVRIISLHLTGGVWLSSILTSPSWGNNDVILIWRGGGYRTGTVSRREG